MVQTVQHIIVIPPVSRWQGDRRPCRAGRATSSCPVVEETAVLRCVNRFTVHEARSQVMVGSCAQAQGQGLPRV